MTVHQFILTTDNFYTANAQPYFDQTVDLDMHLLQDQFLGRLPKRGRILDAGSGSGRDTLAFLKRGYVVDAFDASERLAALSSQFTGNRTRILRFQDFEGQSLYEGIWACASILHVSEKELPSVLRKLGSALKKGGTLYASFKLGHGFRLSADGRAYTDLNLGTAATHFGRIPYFSDLYMWNTEAMDNEPGWLNVIATRSYRSN